MERVIGENTCGMLLGNILNTLDKIVFISCSPMHSELFSPNQKKLLQRAIS